MKLKTELSNEQPFGRHVQWKKAGDMYHDAAYAHALVMAMEDIGIDGDSASMRDITSRASELMHEWGYTED